MQEQTWISEEVVSYFAASPIGPLLEVSRVANSTDHSLSDQLNEALSAVPESLVETVKEDEHFQGLHGRASAEQQDWLAREWAIIEELNRRICDRRKRFLRSQGEVERPVPYDEPALADVEVSDDGLVPLSEFTVEDAVLVRGGRAYTLLPCTRSANASYWITRALVGESLRDKTWVRLDPLMRGDAKDFPRMSYRMLWYGPPLSWQEIVKIREEKFGRWIPGSLSNKSEFTGFAWVPRDGEQHLLLEEVPKREDVECTPSRYLHAIFSRPEERVIHIDGACRFFTQSEWDERVNVHVHRAGKVGIRVKVFRIDVPIEPGPVSNLGGSFFVWNYDIAKFFGADVPDPLLGSVG